MNDPTPNGARDMSEAKVTLVCSARLRAIADDNLCSGCKRAAIQRAEG